MNEREVLENQYYLHFKHELDERMLNHIYKIICFYIWNVFNL